MIAIISSLMNSFHKFCSFVIGTSVPFDIDRKLTDIELEQTFEYCQNDVEETIEVFMNTKSEFDAHMSLITTFGLSIDNLCKTNA